MSDEDYKIICEALEKAEGYFKLRDMMNARIHCDTPRFSPITNLVTEAHKRFLESGGS